MTGMQALWNEAGSQCANASVALLDDTCSQHANAVGRSCQPVLAIWFKAGSLHDNSLVAMITCRQHASTVG